MERHEHQPEAVERGDEHAEEHAPVRVSRARNVRRMHGFDQRVLGEEARRARESRSAPASRSTQVQYVMGRYFFRPPILRMSCS